MKKKLLFSLLIFCSSINVALCDDDFFTEFQKTCEWNAEDWYKGDYDSDDQKCTIDISSPKTISFNELEAKNKEIISYFKSSCDNVIYTENQIWLAYCRNEESPQSAQIVFDYQGIKITCDDGYEFNETRGKCSKTEPEYEPPVEEPEQTPKPVEPQQETESDLLFKLTEDVHDYDGYKPKDLDDAMKAIKQSEYYVDTDKCLTDNFSENPPSISCPGTGKDKGKFYVFHFQSSESDEGAEPVDEEEALDKKEGKPQIEHIYDFRDNEFADGAEALNFIKTSKYKDKITKCHEYDFNEAYVKCTASPEADAKSYIFHFKSISNEGAGADALEQDSTEEKGNVEPSLTAEVEKQLKLDAQQIINAYNARKTKLEKQKK